LHQYINIYIHTYIHTYTHTHTYIHTYTHTHIYIHTYIPAPIQVPPCEVLITYDGVDTLGVADLQDISTFGFASVNKMMSPEGRGLIRLEWECLKDRVDLAHHTVRNLIDQVQTFLVERQMVRIYMESGAEYEAAVAAVAASGVAAVGYEAAVASIAEYDSRKGSLQVVGSSTYSGEKARG
jgi:hypothetical protein